MPWQKKRASPRKAPEVPANVRRKVIRRDIGSGAGCYFSYPGCTGLFGAVEVHHIVDMEDGGNNKPENLAAACKKCHTTHSARTSQKRAVVKAWDFKRRPEKHPGVLD